MADSLSDLFLSLMNFSPISRVRRNHGLEHATLNILAVRHPRLPMAGHSDMSGFWVLGDLSLEDVKSAVEEGLQRLDGGENQLAIHPNCGTNFVASGILAGGAASLAWLGVGKRWQEKLERIPLAFSLATLALIIGQPLGVILQQQVTTDSDPGGLQIVEIIPSTRGRLKAHRIITSG